MTILHVFSFQSRTRLRAAFCACALLSTLTACDDEEWDSNEDAASDSAGMDGKGDALGSTCESDADCGEGFCGWAADGERLCKPWAQAGDFCEGLVWPEDRQFCAPDLICEFAEPTHDVPGICVEPTDDSCASDDECEDGFCGWDVGGDRVCKPWAQEGQWCEGHVFPQDRQFCAPGLICEFAEPTHDVPGMCVDPS